MRPHRIEQNEYPYHVTTRTNGRKFRLKKATYKIFIRVLLMTVQRFNVHIHHVKLMDNHYHMKLFTPDSNLSQIMQFFNYQLAMRINKLQRTSGHLWGQRYHASIVENDFYEQHCVMYMYNNGVRAGLCQCASEDPRLSSFAFYANGTKIPFTVVEDDFYLQLGATASERQAAFRVLMQQSINPQHARLVKEGLRRLFYGSGAFLEAMRQRYGPRVRKKDCLPVTL